MLARVLVTVLWYTALFATVMFATFFDEAPRWKQVAIVVLTATLGSMVFRLIERVFWRRAKKAPKAETK